MNADQSIHTATQKQKKPLFEIVEGPKTRTLQNMWSIIVKELQSYFNSPIGYVSLFLLTLIYGMTFHSQLAIPSFTPGQSIGNIIELILPGTFQSFFTFIVLLVVTPLLTMRLIAEEKHTGTIELLVTLPMKESEIIFAKFLATLAFICIFLATTLLYYVILAVSGAAPRILPTLIFYIGYLLMVSVFLSLGMVGSSIANNQIVAFFVSFAFIIGMFLLPELIFRIPQIRNNETITGVIQYILPLSHFVDFARGVIDARHIVYYVSVTALNLFIATRLLELRK